MTPLWIIPVLVLLLGCGVAVSLAHQAGMAAAELRAEIVRFGELHAALARVGPIGRAGRPRR